MNSRLREKSLAFYDNGSHLLIQQTRAPQHGEHSVLVTLELTATGSFGTAQIVQNVLNLFTLTQGSNSFTATSWKPFCSACVKRLGTMLRDVKPNLTSTESKDIEMQLLMEWLSIVSPLAPVPLKNLSLTFDQKMMPLDTFGSSVVIFTPPAPTPA